MQQLRLSRRHSEILAVLAECPDGMTGEQLGVQLYGDEANPITLRAEMVRLRRLLGDELLASRPYRLRIPVRADFVGLAQLLEVWELLARTAPAGAVRSLAVREARRLAAEYGEDRGTRRAARTAFRSCSAGCC